MAERKYEIDYSSGIDGGQGSVLLGVHKITKQKVAIKRINLTSYHSRLAFESEYRAMTKLSSKIPNVCKIEDVFQDETYGYLVMKRYKCDLFQYAFELEKSLLPEDEVKLLFSKICRGVKALHKARIAHLDLKPENILLDDNYEPFICDFGSAFTCSSMKSNRRKSRACIQEIPALGYRGTRKFSSPEVSATPNIYDPYRADIYSLGVILHVLMTGYYPKVIFDELGNEKRDFTISKNLVSEKCYDLITALTNPDPEERISIDKIFDHPWIKRNRRKSLAQIKMSVATILAKDTAIVN